jgi:hypothetical protein
MSFNTKSSLKTYTKVYEYQPVGMDIWDPCIVDLKPGMKVKKCQPQGCPKNGTFGHCYVCNAETGQFLGLVLMKSLK